MKINPHSRIFNKQVNRSEFAHANRTGQKSFSDTLQQQEQHASQEEMKRKFEQIQLQGERLAKSMTLRELRNYKKMVKQFLEETVRRGVGLKETRGFDRRGRHRRYKILEEIDQHLLSMTDDLIEHEQGRMDLLQKIGEIRGLLVNLLF